MRARPENEGVDFLLYEDHCLESSVSVEWSPAFRSLPGTPASSPWTSVHTPEKMQPGPFSTISPCIAFCPGRLAGGRLFSPRLVGGPPSQAMGWEPTLSSLCVVVKHLNNAPTTKPEPADKTPADTPTTPR